MALRVSFASSQLLREALRLGKISIPARIGAPLCVMLNFMNMAFISSAMWLFMNGANHLQVPRACSGNFSLICAPRRPLLLNFFAWPAPKGAQTRMSTKRGRRLLPSSNCRSSHCWCCSGTVWSLRY